MIVVGYRSEKMSGFTLMELLISITILSVVVVLILSAMRISLRSWEKGESRIEASQRLRAFVEMATVQIEALRIDRQYEDEEGSYYLKGDADTLSFVTTAVPDAEGAFESVHVTYSVEKSGTCMQLCVTEQAIRIDTPVVETAENQAEEIQTTVIPDCSDVHFEYLKSISEENGQEWQDTWLPADEAGVPLAVRISLREATQSAAVRALFRIFLDPTEAVRYQWN